MDDQEAADLAERVDDLLEQVESLADPAARATAVELLQGLLALYGEGLSRILAAGGDVLEAAGGDALGTAGGDLLEAVGGDALGTAGGDLLEAAGGEALKAGGGSELGTVGGEALKAAFAAALAEDELVSHLLLLHGLHPWDVETRVRWALDKARPHLGGAIAEFVGVEGDVARLRLGRARGGCRSSAPALRAIVEDAIRDAAPEIENVQLDAVAPPPVVISVDDLFSRITHGAPDARVS